MVNISNAGWEKWLNKQASHPVYQVNLVKVTQLRSGVSNTTFKFEKLASNKILVPLTKAQLGEKYQSNFLHYVVGVTKIGMGVGAGDELRPDSLFVMSSAEYVPFIVDVIKVTTTK